jgi:hypothetical protein
MRQNELVMGNIEAVRGDKSNAVWSILDLHSVPVTRVSTTIASAIVSKTN